MPGLECSGTVTKSVADLGEGPGGPPLFLDQTETQRDEKNFFSDRASPVRVWMTAPTPRPPSECLAPPLKMVLCPHSGYPSCLSSTLLFQQTPFLQKERCKELGYVKKLIVGKTPRNQRKSRSHRDPVPTWVPEYKVSTLFSGTGTIYVRMLAQVLKKSCVPSEYRTRVPVPGHQVWTQPNNENNR